MTTSFPSVLKKRRLAVVDVEGNGGQPPEIVEIAVLPVNGPVDGRDLRTWLVQPERPITVTAQRIHGISNEDVRRRAPWHGVEGEVRRLLDDRVVVAHAASVEHRVLGAHLRGWRPPMVLDTLRLARRVWPGLPGYGLHALVAHAALDTGGIGEQRPHRAGYDAWCAWLLLPTLLEQGGISSWEDLVEAAALAGFGPQDRPGAGLW